MYGTEEEVTFIIIYVRKTTRVFFKPCDTNHSKSSSYKWAWFWAVRIGNLGALTSNNGTPANASAANWSIPASFQHPASQQQKHCPVSQCYRVCVSSDGSVVDKITDAELSTWSRMVHKSKTQHHWSCHNNNATREHVNTATLSDWAMLLPLIGHTLKRGGNRLIRGRSPSSQCYQSKLYTSKQNMHTCNP